MMEYIIDRLADFSYSLDYDYLPQSVKRKLEICVMDAIECCLSQISDQRLEAALGSIEKHKDLSSVLICSGTRSRAEDAAFYNTVKGALTSRNDSSRTGICHPGSILVPVTFALAEKYRVCGKRILEALVVGYETMIRLGTAFVMSHINGSWRNTSLVAPFGAAFSAAKMLGLDVGKTASAASFSCHSAGGVNEWAVSGTGEDVFQNGWGARNGIISAYLAQAGASGCHSILEGRSGLFNAFDVHCSFDEFCRDLGEKYGILEIMHKPIDSCFLVQGPCQTAKSVVEKMPIGAEKMISRIEIRVSQQAMDYPGCNNKSINSLVQGIMSIPLGVASAVVNRSTEAIRWMPPIDSNVISLMSKCNLVADEHMTEKFPMLQGAEIIIYLDNGDVYSAKQDDVIPLTDDEVESRFMRTASSRLGNEKGEKLYQLILTLNELDDISEIAKLLL